MWQIQFIGIFDNSYSMRAVLNNTSAEITPMILVRLFSLESSVGCGKILMSGFACLFSIFAETLSMVIKPLRQMSAQDMDFPWQSQVNALIKEVFTVFL